MFYLSLSHADVMTWKPFPCDWTFVRRAHRWIPLTKVHVYGALIISLLFAPTSWWINSRADGDLRPHVAPVYNSHENTGITHCTLWDPALPGRIPVKLSHACRSLYLIGFSGFNTAYSHYPWITWKDPEDRLPTSQGAVSIRKTVLPGMAIPMLKIRRSNGRLIFNMEIAIRR